MEKKNASLGPAYMRADRKGMDVNKRVGRSQTVFLLWVGIRPNQAQI